MLPAMLNSAAPLFRPYHTMQEAAQQGATAAPSADEEVDLHFAAFVCCDGALYELDGR